MICHNNLVFSVLYRGDLETTHRLVSESAARLGAAFEIPWESCTLRCLFILLLNQDLTLKEQVLRGTDWVGPLDPRKAEAFFLALRPQLIDHWLRNERLGPNDLLDEARNLYLVS